jgi:hypothetical protein
MTARRGTETRGVHRVGAGGDMQREREREGRLLIELWAKRLLVGLLSIVCASCDQAEFFTCPHPDLGSPHPCPDPADMSTCLGQCVPATDQGWTRPSLVWVGAKEDAPECPQEAPMHEFDGYSGLVVEPPHCAPCECEPPEVACALPSRMTTSTAACPGEAPGSTHVSFDAPDAWDGSCSADYAVAPGALCNGEPCVASLTAEPPLAISTGCRVKSPPPSEPVKSTWTSSVLACTGTYVAQCPSLAEICGPKPPASPPDGFDLCVYQDGVIEECPSGWGRRSVYYSAEYEGRGGDWACSACDCSVAIGASCTIAVSVFSDSACSSLLDFHVVSSDDGPLCRDVSSGVGLGSKSAELISSKPGACTPSGGEVLGDPALVGATTFCCLD